MRSYGRRADISCAKRIARELHDSLGHSLVAINVRAGVSQHLGDPDGSSLALGEIKDVSANALRDLRSTLDVLRDRGEAAPTRPNEGIQMPYVVPYTVFHAQDQHLPR